jgi:competence ComEA-like helix-hairpin-helix protein
VLIGAASGYRYYQNRSLDARLELLPPVADSLAAQRDDNPAPHLLTDLNSATSVELQRLPGIGPVKADRILELREKLGGFDSIEQLDQVNGIGMKTVERLRPFVTIEDRESSASPADTLNKP